MKFEFKITDNITEIKELSGDGWEIKGTLGKQVMLQKECFESLSDIERESRLRKLWNNDHQSKDEMIEVDEKRLNASMDLTAQSSAGINAIVIERSEQVARKGYTPIWDVKHRSEKKGGWFPLVFAAYGMLNPNVGSQPEFMDKEAWEKIVNKPYRDRLVVAGALIAAEIDRFDLAESMIKKHKSKSK